MEILSQKDPRWANILLGTSNYYIWAKGCLITELAEALGVTPVVVNNKLNELPVDAAGNTGFAKDTTGQRSWVIWAKIAEAFPGVQVRREWSYNNDDVLAALAAGAKVIVEVDAAPIGAPGGKHWVRYIGLGKLHNPWDMPGQERPTSDFPNPTGYAVIVGKYEELKAEPIPEAPAQPETPTAGEVYQGLDITNVKSVKAAIDTWHDVVTGHYVTTEQYEDVFHQVCEALEIDQTKDIQTIVQNIKTLKEDFKSQVLVAANLPQGEQIEGQGPASQPVVAPEVTLKNVPDHEKNALLAEVLKIEDSLKTLLGL